MSKISDEVLMERALNGDASAFEQLYDRYADRLLKYAMRFVDDTMQAEDLVHEAFMKLLERPKAFDLNRKFSTWLYTITGNLCKNHLRNTSNRNRLNKEMQKETTVEQNNSKLDRIALQSKIKQLFKQLNDKEQEVFVLRFEMALSIREISEIMQIPEGSVKSCLYYLLRKMAPQLSEYSNE